MKDNTKELLKLIVAKLKAEAVIESCIHYKQCVAARKYIDLFFDRFKEPHTYGHLMQLYIDKSLMLNIK